MNIYSSFINYKKNAEKLNHFPDIHCFFIALQEYEIDQKLGIKVLTNTVTMTMSMTDFNYDYD